MRFTAPNIFFYIIIPVVIFLIGKSITAEKNMKHNYEKYTKIASKIKLHPMIFRNYIGNLIKFFPILYLSFIAYGIFNSTTYAAAIVVLLLSMTFHIRDVSGKPIDIILSNLLGSINQMKSNFFMRFTILMSVSIFFTYLIMTSFIKPYASDLINANKTTTPNIEIIEETK